jgi:isopenicillin-N N-acyltransferase like protein
MRVLDLRAGVSPREWGRQHGETFRHEIRSLAEMRIHLCRTVGRFQSDARVLDVAEQHLPILREWDADAYEEIVGIAEGADCDPARIVVLNHYTDMRDLDPEAPLSVAISAGGEEGCSVVLAQTRAGPVLAQTWDMHATAIPYVMLLRVPPRPGPDGTEIPGANVLTLTGCVGMAGLNEAGLGICINNLRSTDATAGVVWPSLVRRVLQERVAERGRDAILGAPIGSGHHYLVATAESAFGIETSGIKRKVVFDGGAGWTAGGFIHTNHCLDKEVGEVTAVPEGSTTWERLSRLTESFATAPAHDLFDVWERLGSHEGYPRSICVNLATPQNPHLQATCGAIAMDLARKETFAEAGFIHNVAPTRFGFMEQSI